MLVLDDFTPSPTWPPPALRQDRGFSACVTSATQLVAAEVLVRPEEACILLTLLTRIRT